MIKISFSFEGCIDSVELDVVRDTFGEKVNLENIGMEAVRSNLQSGFWLISLVDYLDNPAVSIDIFDVDTEYEPEKT